MERPQTLTIAAALVAVQGVAAVAWGVVELVRALTGHPHDQDTAVMLGVLVLVLAAGVFFAAYGLWRMKRWAQAPTYLVQFFSIVVGMGQLTKLPLLMVPLIAVGAATLVFASLPSSREALDGI